MICHAVTQETPLPGTVHRALVPVHIELETSLQKPTDRGQYTLAGTLGPYINITVIRVSTERVAPPFQFLVQIIQQDVGQERRERTALRRTFSAPGNQTTIHNSRLKVPADKSEDPPVFDPPSHPEHQNVMVHPIKELLQIHINHPTTTGSNILTGITHRMMSASARAESIARIRKVWIKDWLQNLMQSLLNETIQQLAFDARPVLACGFLQIPPHGGHPCRPASSSPCRDCKGLTPPSGCALPGALKKGAPFRSPLHPFKNDVLHHYTSSPSQAPWFFLAQAFVTVPLVIARHVPGMPTVPRYT
ncbi:hypothetical protein BMS3Abin14_02206 [bacterium BMS3Abin14]|nr:hypothetical protein BMS3Abin14_02206 [bacterium BMS3Abin14]